MKHQGDIYVSLPHPSEYRVMLLECTKSSLESMKVFRALGQVRHEKIKLKNELRKQLRQLTNALNKVKRTIPYIDIPNVPLPKKADVKKVEPQIQKPKNELDRIESELKEIEGKISSIR